MRVGQAMAICVALIVSTSAKSAEFNLPKEVTPALRAACESGVRRLCIGADPTVAKVKRCVFVKFMSLGRRCRVELAAAGLSRTN